VAESAQVRVPVTGRVTGLPPEGTTVWFSFTSDMLNSLGRVVLRRVLQRAFVESTDPKVMVPTDPSELEELVAVNVTTLLPPGEIPAKPVAESAMVVDGVAEFNVLEPPPVLVQYA
jgi:hypothetical protein